MAEEVGEQGTPHLQGRFRFKRTYRKGGSTYLRFLVSSSLPPQLSFFLLFHQFSSSWPWGGEAGGTEGRRRGELILFLSEVGDDEEEKKEKMEKKRGGCGHGGRNGDLQAQGPKNRTGPVPGHKAAKKNWSNFITGTSTERTADTVRSQSTRSCAGFDVRLDETCFCAR